MKLFKLRVGAANRLVKLAWKIRPNTVNGIMKSLEDAFMFGDGAVRISPQELYTTAPNKLKKG